MCKNYVDQDKILESEISKEQLKKMSAVCEKKHDKVIQQFV